MKTAILVDGGFYRRRAQIVKGTVTPEQRAQELIEYCKRHLNTHGEKNDLYRIFYYDCPPSTKKVFHPFLSKQIDLEKSDGKNFVMVEEENALIMPFSSLDGLGDAVASKIMEERAIKPFYSIEDFQLRGKVNQATIAKLRSMNIFGSLPETSQLSLF